MVIKSIIEIISFLTIIPVHKFSKSANLESISKNMHLFPIIGLIIGLLSMPIAIISFYFFNNLISGFLITSFLIIITGIHHTDALADFSDGLMVKGNKEKKYKVIHDPMIGSAGTVAIISYFIGMVVTISSFTGTEKLIISVVISEIIAKYSIVLQAFFSESAWEGYSSLFTKNMKSRRKIIISTTITAILIILIGQSIQLLIRVFIIGIICCFLITYTSKKNFGGVSGDVMGATNELVRLCCLISLSPSSL
ncbi:MAG: adenosylcobinamide-GDP ribazoletransferase [Candidatus Nitrosocosmicus sp.]